MEATKAGNRNYCMDFIKGIACICVVFMHCEFPGQVGIVVQTVSRFCVPFFFMVSGYYCFENSTQKIKKKILHILTITTGASLLYLLFAAIQHMGGVEGVFSFSLLDIGLFVFLNSPVVIAGQLWFLFALLYDYGLFYLIAKFDKVRWTYKLIPVLVLLYVLFAQGAVLLGFHIPKLLYRNFLIEGFTFFMMGHWLHANIKKVEKIDNNVIITGITISTIMTIVERYFMGRDFGVNIFSFPQVLFIFAYAMNNGLAHKDSIFRKLGLRCSMYVYILHPLVWHSIEYVYKLAKIDKNLIALYILPIIVLGLSIALSLIVTRKKKEA